MSNQPFDIPAIHDQKEVLAKSLGFSGSDVLVGLVVLSKDVCHQFFYAGDKYLVVSAHKATELLPEGDHKVYHFNSSQYCIHKMEPLKVERGDDLHNPVVNLLGSVLKIYGQGEAKVMTKKGIFYWTIALCTLIPADDGFYED